MKSFFHEALTHYGHSASKCIVDNTNLAVLRGAGRDAIMHPEIGGFRPPLRLPIRRARTPPQ